jgi:hypothetical protein
MTALVMISLVMTALLMTALVMTALVMTASATTALVMLHLCHIPGGRQIAVITNEVITDVVIINVVITNVVITNVVVTNVAITNVVITNAVITSGTSVIFLASDVDIHSVMTQQPLSHDCHFAMTASVITNVVVTNVRVCRCGRTHTHTHARAHTHTHLTGGVIASNTGEHGDRGPAAHRAPAVGGLSLLSVYNVFTPCLHLCLHRVYTDCTPAHRVLRDADIVLFID